MRIFKTLAIVASMSLLVTSCKTPKDITYLQGFNNGDVMTVTPAKDITAQPGDRISILVHSKDAALAEQFNLPVQTRRTGQVLTGTMASGMYSANSGSGNGQTSSYVVDNFGDIEYPVLGTIHVADKTRHEISRMIESEIKSRKLIKDPTVTVEFLDHSITFLGAVSQPGRKIFDRDQLTLLEGIGLAGDLAITGQRTNVKVIRQEDGKERAYEVDLTNPESVYSSPVYYLQPNDIIYVEPNNMAKRSTTPMSSSAFTPAFWMSVLSFAASMVVLVAKW